MARKPNQGGNVWPSFELASRLYDLANIAFIVSLIVGVFATVLLVWMGNVKEGFLRRDVAQAGAHAADANERAAALEKEAANARLETENLRSQLVPRRLKRDAFVKALVDVPKAAVEIIYARDDFESIEFAQEIAIFLEKGNWQVTSRHQLHYSKNRMRRFRQQWQQVGSPLALLLSQTRKTCPPMGLKSQT